MQGGSRGKSNPNSAKPYNLRSRAKSANEGSTGNILHHQTFRPARRGASFSVSHAYTSVMDTLNKRKPRVFIPGLTPAASLDKPTHSSTPAIEFPRAPGPTPKATNRSFPPTTQPVTLSWPGDCRREDQLPVRLPMKSRL